MFQLIVQTAEGFLNLDFWYRSNLTFVSLFMIAATPIPFLIDFLRPNTRSARTAYLPWNSVVKRHWLSLSCFPKLLSLVKHLLRNNGLIAARDEVHLSFSSVAFLFPRERVCCIPFLEKCISCVALILQDIVNRFSPPMPSKRLIFVQSSSNFSWIIAA